jgi:ubiquinone/menaquinone biosynthesis C-methylase UbiE
MLHKTLLYLDEKVLFPARRNYLQQKLSPLLTAGEKILDLGASDGRLAHTLREKVDAEFTGCDVHVLPVTYIPIVKYDGYKLPFEDQSFDCVMIIDVLHHDTDPESVIREAKRVARRTVLIKDHYYNHGLDFFGLKVMDYVGNAPYGIRLPYNYLKDSEWRAMLQRLDLRIVHEDKFRYNLIDPCLHVIFKLDVGTTVP